MARLMSDAEIRRRKKLQGTISQTTGALGLASVGAFGAARLGGASRFAQKAQKAAPALKRINPKKADLGALGASTTAGGIGGAGSFNFAAYTNAESRKRQRPATVGQPPSRVKKSEESEMDIGHYGEIGRPLKPEQIEKAWSPVGASYDSEAKREKRSKVYESGALVGAGAGGAYGAHHGIRAVHEGGKAKQALGNTETLYRGTEFKQTTPARTRKVTPKGGGKPQVKVTPSKTETKLRLQDGPAKARVEAVDVGRASKYKTAVRARNVHGGKAALGVGAVAAAAGAHGAIKRKRKQGSWQPYAKSAKSAFGVDHQ